MVMNIADVILTGGGELTWWVIPIMLMRVYGAAAVQFQPAPSQWGRQAELAKQNLQWALALAESNFCFQPILHNTECCSSVYYSPRGF